MKIDHLLVAWSLTEEILQAPSYSPKGASCPSCFFVKGCIMKPANSDAFSWNNSSGKVCHSENGLRLCFAPAGLPEAVFSWINYTDRWLRVWQDTHDEGQNRGPSCCYERWGSSERGPRTFFIHNTIDSQALCLVCHGNSEIPKEPLPDCRIFFSALNKCLFHAQTSK